MESGAVASGTHPKAGVSLTIATLSFLRYLRLLGLKLADRIFA